MSSNSPKQSPYDWIAPEHWIVAKGMNRVKVKNNERHAKLYPFGELVIEEHPIFKYSRKNPPPHVLKSI